MGSCVVEIVEVLFIATIFPMKQETRCLVKSENGGEGDGVLRRR